MADKISPYLRSPARSLREYLAELEERYRQLPPTSYATRGKLLTEIRNVKLAMGEASR